MERGQTWEEALVTILYNSDNKLESVSETGKAYIHGAIAMLPDCQREVVIARIQDGLTLKECAKKLGISTTRVSFRGNGIEETAAPKIHQRT